MPDERYPSDGAQWTHLRQHEPKEPLNMRHTAKGAVYDREKIPDPNATQEPVKIGRDILKPVGNQANWQHWIGADKRSDRSMPRDNRFGAWTMAMPSVVVGDSVEALATMIRPDDLLLSKQLVTDEVTIQRHAALVRKDRGFAPIVREKIYPLWPEGDPIVKRLPTGMPGVTLTTTYPDEQIDVFLPSPLGALISDHRSVTPDLFSSVVYDIQGDTLSLRYHARLSNAVRVALPAPGFGREPGLALLGTRSPSSFGYATYWFNGSFRPSAPIKKIITGANRDEPEPGPPTRDEIPDKPLGGLGNYAPFSWEKGGPMHPGAGKTDKHFHGLDADGTPWSGGHTDTHSLYYMDIVRDAPLDFETPFHPITREGLFPYQVHLQYDKRVRHTWEGQDIEGMWRWHVKIPILPPWVPTYPEPKPKKKKPKDPIDDPPIDETPKPRPKPKTGEPDPKPPRLHKPISEDSSPPAQSNDIPKGIVTGPDRVERTRRDGAPPNDSPAGNAIGAAAKAARDAIDNSAEAVRKAAIDAVGVAREAMRNAQSERAGASAPDVGETAVLSVSVVMPSSWKPVADSQVNDTYGDMMNEQRLLVTADRQPPSHVRLRIETPGGSKAAPATIPYETAMPSLFGMAVPTLANTPAWNRFGATEAVGAFYAAPLTGHLQAFGSEVAGIGWSYTHKPGFYGGSGPYQRGTGVGGLAFLPPEVNLDDLDPWRTATTGAARISPQTLLIHTANSLGFGSWDPELPAVVSGVVVKLTDATTLDFSFYDTAGVLDPTGALSLNGAPFSGLTGNELTAAAVLANKAIVTGTGANRATAKSDFTATRDGTNVLSVSAGTDIAFDSKNLSAIGTISRSGNILQKQQVRAYAGSGTSVSAATWTQIAFASETFDVDSVFASNTFTAGVACKLRVTAQVSTDIRFASSYLPDPDNNAISIAIYKNGSLFSEGHAVQVLIGINVFVAGYISDELTLAATDTVKIYFYSVAGCTAAGNGSGLDYVTFERVD